MKFLKEPSTWLIAAFLFVAIIVPGFGIYFAGKEEEAFAVSCGNAGGKVIRLRRDSLCVSSDGRIIEDY